MITRRTAMLALGGLFAGIEVLPESVAQVKRELERDSALDLLSRTTTELVTIPDEFFIGEPFMAWIQRKKKGNLYLTQSGEWRREFSPGPLRLDPERLPE